MTTTAPAELGVTVVLARPFASVTELALATEPLLLDQLIVKPCKGVPPSFSSTTIGAEAWPVARVWPSPEKTVSCVATFASDAAIV